ncbi:NAD-dependent epimerase/dehydratase family protein [Thermanaeromonas sp. C210]|uniref:NAD-dependent epimerase/dehydratase family protein n=1 Tax=Thermanaeromonas sp. C210 TaxID=2731925 RepID=UPI00155CD6DB|nr:NAD-dependent epimerase/dehydratase family protein [Thermanaeromonas sp. C210]GFN23901.1 NDP-sugar dehydratase or epimerase [Thermanaeromonas sp. C210]
MKHVLVTGGAGFIGSNLVRMLVNDYGCEVTVLDNMYTGCPENLGQQGIATGVQLVTGTVLDQPLVRKLIQGKDTIFHLAAVNITASMENARADLETNIIGTYNVLEAAHQAGVARVVYASTASVYGNPEYLPVCEEDRVRFLNFYAASKYAGECYAQVFYEQYDLPVTVVRYSNVYGYNQRPENPYAGVVARFINWALHDAPLRIYGDGSQTRDFTFIADACRATVLAALCPQAVGKVYNIATGTETTINELARIVIELTSSKSKVLYEDRRPIDNVHRRVLNVEKARKELGFFPEWTLTRGLQETINWARSLAIDKGISGGLPA